MNYQNTRVQVYLNANDVKLADELAQTINVGRSQVIRDAVSAVVERYVQVAALLLRKKPKKHPLLELGGAVTSKTGTVSQNIDDVSLYD